MSITISNVYVKTYENSVRHLAQQGVSRLRPWVMEKSVNSEAHNWETMNTVDANPKAGARATTPLDDSVWGRRQTQNDTWDVADTVEQEDVVQMVINPQSNIAMTQGAALKRAFDDAIIIAATGPSRREDGTTIDFPDGTSNLDPAQNPTDDMQQVIQPGYASPLSFDLITEVTEKYMDNDIDPDENKLMVIGPKQARKLLQLTEATSGDYNALRPLTSKGYVESWMGYSWVVSTRLNIPGANQIDCFCMTRKAIGLQVNRDITAKIAEDPTRSFLWVIYCMATFGAIRIEDKHLVWMQLSDTV